MGVDSLVLGATPHVAGIAKDQKDHMQEIALLKVTLSVKMVVDILSLASSKHAAPAARGAMDLMRTGVIPKKMIRPKAKVEEGEPAKGKAKAAKAPKAKATKAKEKAQIRATAAANQNSGRLGLHVRTGVVGGPSENTRPAAHTARTTADRIIQIAISARKMKGFGVKSEMHSTKRKMHPRVFLTSASSSLWGNSSHRQS